MRPARIISKLLLVSLLFVTTAALQCSNGNKQGNANANKQDSEEKAREIVRKGATGFVVAARGVDAGIDTVRAFREAGEITPEHSLELARIAKDVNDVMAEAVEFVLSQSTIDGAGAETLAEQLDRVIASAQRLSQAGTLHLKNGRTKLIFELGVTGGRTGLRIALDELRAGAQAGIQIPLDQESLQKFRSARETIRRNDARLREAITRLGGSI